MNRTRHCLLPVLLALLVAACEKAEQEYSTAYPCSFVFNTRLHPASLLTRIHENANAFVIVEATNYQGAHLLRTTSGTGEKDSLLLSTERENNSVRAMGAGNSLIVGCLFVAADPPYLYVAYDGQCRYCLDNSSSHNNPLAFDPNGLSVSCARCRRSYQLSTGTSADGQRLYTYHARYNEASGLLSVSNN